MLYKIKIFLKKYWHLLAVTLIAIIFFIGASGFNYIAQKNDFIKWLSPDETANYNFTKLYAQAGRLEFFEKYNILAQDIIHPRSLRSDFGWLKPVSFLGIILIYGKIAGLLGYKVIPFLTPFFAALGIIFYYLLIKEIFSRKIALLSALLLASFPAYIYYSARSMFHNVLFVVLLIASLYFAVMSVKKRESGAARWLQLLSAALAGSFLGLAIITRTSELIWLAPLWLIIWLFNLKKFGFLKLLIFIAFMMFTLLPAVYWNKILYQSYWQGGYNEMNRSIAGIAVAGSAILKTSAIKNNLTQIKNNIFYFGWQPLKSLKMLYYYFAAMFYWIFWPAALGLLLFLQRIKTWRKRHYAYLAALIVISAILIFYYGSWDFHDNPDPKSHTIGNSYVRYWLPIYLGAIPFVGIFLLQLTGFFKKKFLVYGLRFLLIALIYFISLKFVLYGSDEGLVNSARNLLASRREFDKVLSATEDNSIVITRYHDKLFFPERKVIVGLFNDDNMNREYRVLAGYLPVYYYNFTYPEKDINYLNNSKLPQFNLQIKPVKQITNDFTLYKLSTK